MRPACFALLLTLVVGGAASAQTADESRWAVTGSFTPQFTTLSSIRELFGTDIDLRGGDVSIGVGRGRVLGGDWAVQFVRRSFKETAAISDVESSCFSSGAGERCFDEGAIYRLRQTSMAGVEAQKFMPFATIRQRVQIGMTLGGGIAYFKGTTERTLYEVLGTFQQPVARVTSDSVPAKDAAKDAIGIDFLPLGRAEITAAAILGRAKVKVGGGFHFPGTANVTVAATYLF